ncbi:hypothetical protein [Acidianus sp. HS-5]|nr:hypothetical protein [Acidianus sp. HS-5]
MPALWWVISIFIKANVKLLTNVVKASLKNYATKQCQNKAEWTTLE